MFGPFAPFPGGGTEEIVLGSGGEVAGVWPALVLGVELVDGDALWAGEWVGGLGSGYGNGVLDDGTCYDEFEGSGGRFGVRY